MGTDSSIFKKAISEVDQERSYLSTERHTFQEFRESVRLAQPVPKADINQSKTTGRLREAYREEVMEVLGHKGNYGDTLVGSLE